MKCFVQLKHHIWRSVETPVTLEIPACLYSAQACRSKRTRRRETPSISNSAVLYPVVCNNVNAMRSLKRNCGGLIQFQQSEFHRYSMDIIDIRLESLSMQAKVILSFRWICQAAVAERKNFEDDTSIGTGCREIDVVRSTCSHLRLELYRVMQNPSLGGY